MGEPRFSAGEALQFGWQQTKSKFWFFAAVLIIAFILAMILSVATGMVEPNSPANMMLSLITTLFNIIVSMGIIANTLEICDGRPVDFFHFISKGRLILNYFFASVIYGLIVFLGFLLLIIPGMILAVRLQFFTYLIVDRQLGPVQALKQSAEITKSCTFSLFLFGVLIVIINFIGMIIFGIGLFASVPTTLIAIAYVYRKLLTQNQEAGDSNQQTN
jgi:uncharacterized membrane protein